MTTGWENLAPATTPPARFGQTAAYNPSTGKVIMYGGSTTTSGGYTSDTYEWNGIDWTLLTPAANPGLRINMALCYDPVTDSIIGFGGQLKVVSTFSFPKDTWQWTGTNWVQLSPTHHSTVATNISEFYSMAYDENNGNVVMWEYLAAVGSGFGATWIWNGSDWLIQSPTHQPPHRFSMLAYDRVRQKVVMGPGNFSGVTNVYADVWEWNGSDWTQNTAALPTTPFSTTYISNNLWQYAENCGGIVSYGGNSQFSTNNNNETWMYDSTWHDLAPSSPPNERAGMAHAVDSSGKILMYGGLKDDNVTFYSDTWHFSCTAIAPSSAPILNNAVSLN